MDNKRQAIAPLTVMGNVNKRLVLGALFHKYKKELRVLDVLCSIKALPYGYRLTRAGQLSETYTANVRAVRSVPAVYFSPAAPVFAGWAKVEAPLCGE